MLEPYEGKLSRTVLRREGGSNLSFLFGYDRAKYYEYLLRGAESMLLPFGYTEERLDEIMKGKIQKNLLFFAG